MRLGPEPEEFLKQSALETGFSLVGISRTGHPEKSRDIFDSWLAAEKHAGMRYLSRWPDRRNDPGLLLPEARSIISLALDYWPGMAGDPAPRSRQRRGQFSLYAHGRDYHQVAGDLLAELTVVLTGRFPGLKTMACVDTRPVAERTWALLAGIGWLGRNGCVISPSYGSWIFLAELITNLDLEPDQPLAGSCGDCRLCVEACPTGALRDDSTLDAGRCLSYLTIEHRGEIPARFHRPMGGRLFGCDECQRVCPYNQSRPPTRVEAFKMRHPVLDLDVNAIIHIRERELEAVLSGSAAARCGSAGLKRNARIVQANISSGE